MKRFFVWFFSIIGFISFCFVMFFLVSLKYFAPFIEGEKDKLGSNSILEIQIGRRSLSDMGGGLKLPFFMDDFVKHQHSLYDTIRAIDHASTDNRIKGIFLNIAGARLSASQAQEIRAALKRFRLSGKKVVAYANSFGDGQNGTAVYYLACVSDEVWMQPRGMVSLVGLMVEGHFFHSLLETYKVLPQMFQREEYKGLTENLTHNSFSEAVRTNTQNLLKHIHTQVVHDLSGDLAIEKGKMASLVEEGPYTEEEAKKVNLVKHLGYYHEIRKQFLDQVSPKASFVRLNNYLQAIDSSLFRHSKQIALISIDGTLVGSDHGAPKEVNAFKVANSLHKAIQDKNVLAIVLRINSPGGTVSTAESIWHQVANAVSSGKPVIVSMGSYAASAGYMIAAPATKIFATPATITGSIGVASGKVSLGTALEQFGVHSDRIKSGENTDFWSFSKPFSEAQVKKMDGSLDYYYHDFLDKVAKGRRMSMEAVRAVAKGQVWSGEQAKEQGLVDELGGIYEAIKMARDLVGDAEAPAVIYTQEKTLQHELQSLFEWSDRTKAFVQNLIPYIDEQVGIRASIDLRLS